MDQCKDVLIFMDESKLKPIGGPSGYVYGLKTELENRENSRFQYLEGTGDTLKRYIPKTIKVFLHHIVTLAKIFFNYNKSFDFSSYKAVHFHSTIDLYLNLKNLKKYKGKVIITSHSPKPMHREILEDMLTPIEKIIYWLFLINIQKIDKRSFERADFIFFPCKEAEEPYLNNWKYYSTIKNNMKGKFEYLPTGTFSRKAKKTREDILSEHNIPLTAFVITYAGRHNKTKGYDVLKKIGEELIKVNPNIYFLVAGEENPIKGLESERWIEVGWTNDPHSIIAAGDLFILPNKETYFDLILLEVMSLGKSVLISETGGNKFFKKFKVAGLNYFASIEEANKKISVMYSESQINKKMFYEDIRSLFQSEFSIEIFADRYQNLINKILD